ncbi:MAG TPA: GNAT family N-acetyltransferase, partial [Firmicutes bacterium]|nr:GNAT family N-acetyltransferase [Bacillota bacterium]
MGGAMRGLKLRDARNADKKVVLDFCRNTWPGYGDFIPQVWDRWIRQRRGRFIVAELEGQPVGIAKITDFGYGEIWLEGLRVDPRHRRKGIARAINREVLRTLKLIKPRVARFCTAQSNRASRKIGSQYGFSVIARFRYYWDEPRRGRISGEVVG